MGKMAPCPRCGQPIPVRPPAASHAARQIPAQSDDDFWDQIPIDPTPAPSNQATLEAEAFQQETLTGNKAVAYVINQVSLGESAGDIRQGLISSGTSEGEADRVLETILGDSRKVRRAKSSQTGQSSGMAKGAKHLLVGGVVCLIGVGVTVGSFVAAKPGGVFLLAWGPIVFGGLEAFYGLVMLLSGSGSGSGD